MIQHTRSYYSWQSFGHGSIISSRHHPSGLLHAVWSFGKTCPNTCRAPLALVGAMLAGLFHHAVLVL
jgi:hypothetical protein